MHPLYPPYRSVLEQFVAHASISTDPSHLEACKATAEALKTWLEPQGYRVELVPSSTGRPLVFANLIVNPTLPTCLVYGHYDVQPASISDGWETPPFTLTEKEGKLIARGSTDNKGQFLLHLSAIAELLRTKQLSWNIQLLIEGDEEAGSEGVIEFLTNNPEKITADCALISDGEIHDLIPKIELGFRGTLQVGITLQTATADLHSGLFGGTVPNAATELVSLLSTLHNDDHSLAVAGIDEGCYQPSEQEAAWATESTPASYQHLTGTKTVWSESGQSIGTQLIFRPTIEIIGMAAGYMGEGYRNSIAAKASAKLNVRIVPGQNPEKVMDAIKTHLHSHTPEYATLTIENDSHGGGILVDASAPIFDHTEKVLEQSYGKKVSRQYCGASLPFLAAFQSIPNLDLVLVPLANDDCLMHAVGENIAITNIEKGLAFSQLFFSTPWKA